MIEDNTPKPRTRSSFKQANSTRLFERTYIPANSVLVPSTSVDDSLYTYVDRRTMNDFIVPKFRSRSSNGETFFNDCSAEQNSATDSYIDYVVSTTPAFSYSPRGTFSSKHRRRESIFRNLENTIPTISADPMGIDWKTYFGLDKGLLVFDESQLSALTEVSQTQAYAKVSMSEASLYVTAGEFKESISLLQSVAVGLLRSIRALKKADYRYFKNQMSLEDLEDKYLEFRYGLRPMISEVQGIIAAASRKVTANRQTARSAYLTVDEKIFSSSCLVKDSTVGAEIGYKIDVVSTLSVNSGVLYQFSIEDLDNQFFKYGFEEPLEAIIDLVPLSFILGWFFNLQDLLASWTPNYGLQHVGSWTTTRRKATIRFTPVSVRAYQTPAGSKGTAPYYAQIIEGVGSSIELSNWQRVCNIPKPYWPHLNIRLDVFKKLDMFLIGKNIASSLFLRGHQPKQQNKIWSDLCYQIR